MLKRFWFQSGEKRSRKALAGGYQHINQHQHISPIVHKGGEEVSWPIPHAKLNIRLIFFLAAPFRQLPFLEWLLFRVPDSLFRLGPPDK